MAIEFEEPLMNFRTIDISDAVSRNTPFLVKHKIAKDLKTANAIMWIAVVVIIAASGAIYYTRPSVTEKKYKEDFTIEELQHMLPETVDRLPSKPQ